MNRILPEAEHTPAAVATINKTYTKIFASTLHKIWNLPIVKMKVTPLALYLLAYNFLAQGVHATHEGTIPPLGTSPPGNNVDAYHNECKVCADGSIPLNLDAQLGLNITGYNSDTFEYDNLSNLTCGSVVQAYLEKYNIYTFEYPQCNLIQFAGIERCGCPDLRVNPCILCKDEKDEFDPDTLIQNIFEGGNITCFQLAAFISDSNETCSAYQATVGERCGCSKVPNLQCPSLCGPGNAIPDPGRMFDGDTCDTLELYTTIDREIYGCGFFGGYLAIVSEYCCADEAGPTSSPTKTPLCPATPCADGSSSPLNLADVELGLNLTLYNFNGTGTGGYEYVSDLTCGNVQDFIEKNSIPYYSFNCDEITYAATVRCECPRQDNDECYLCEDEQNAFNAQTPAPVGFGYDTCLDLALGAFYFFPANSSVCTAEQATAGEYCGCSNPVARAALECTLCDDNTIPNPNRMFVGSSCAVWEFYVVQDCNYSLSENSGYISAIEYCCAEEAAPTAAPSDLVPPLCNPTPCNDGSSPSLSFANVELGLKLTEFNYTTSSYEFVTDLTCGNVQDFMERNYVESYYRYECNLIQFAGIVQCGCPDLRVNACDLCEDDNSHFDPTKAGPNDYHYNCLHFAHSVSSYNNYSCPLMQATLGEYCGCSNPVARAALECPLCGPGTKVPDPSRMFSGQKCAVWEYHSSLYCSRSHDFLDAAEYCCGEDSGPTGSPTKAPLCPAMPCADGSIPPPSFAEVELGLSNFAMKLTCSNVHGFIEDYGITESSDGCQRIEFAGIMKCGCPDLRVGACNLCEDGMDLFNFDSPSPFSSYSTCFDEAYTAYSFASIFSILDDSYCSRMQATVGEYCGCSNPVARAALLSPLCGRGNAIPDPSRMFGGYTCAAHEYQQHRLFSSNYILDPDVFEYCCAEEGGPTSSPTDAPLCSAAPCADGSIPSLDFVNVKLGITLSVFDYATSNYVYYSNLKCGGTSVHDFIEKYKIPGYHYECDWIRLAGIEKCGCPSTEIGPVGNEPSLAPVIAAPVIAAPVIAAPVIAPAKVPANTPVIAPANAPVIAPVSAPVIAPVVTPSSSPSSSSSSDGGSGGVMIMATKTEGGGKMSRARYLQSLAQGGAYQDRHFRGV
jgi:hypothetical protein